MPILVKDMVTTIEIVVECVNEPHKIISASELKKVNDDNSV